MRAALVVSLVAVAVAQLGVHGRSILDDALKHVEHHREDMVNTENRHLQSGDIEKRQEKREISIDEVMEQDKDSILAINMKSGYASGLLDGDILLNEHQMANLRSGRSKRSSFVGDAWPNIFIGKPIGYFFDKTFPEEGRELFRKVVEIIEKKTCVRFEENSGVLGSVRIYNNNTDSEHDACFATLGKYYSNPHIHLGKSCFHFGVVFHETMHVLGFMHTQSRTDRDKFVTINYDNINTTSLDLFNFDSLNTSNKFIYDYGSMMHYSSKAGALDRKKMTIDPVDNLFDFTPGQREEPSFYDILSINHAYKCLDKCASGHAECMNGGVPKANDCQACECPRGFGGATCEDMDKPGLTLNALSHNQTVTLDASKTYWIKADCGQRVHLEFVNATQYHCYESCNYGYWNVKSKADPRNSGYRVCCEVQMGVADVSESHMIILTTNNANGAEYTIKYSAVHS